MSAIRPVFRIFDVPKALEFYVDWLGFKVDWEHRFGEHFPLYMQVSKDDLILHLSEHYGDACPGAKILIEYSGDLPAYQKELCAKDYRYFKPGLEDTHYGTIMDIIDPFGNKISFCIDKVTK